MSWGVCGGQQEAQFALLFSSFLQGRAGEGLPDSGTSAGLKYSSDPPSRSLRQLHSGTQASACFYKPTGSTSAVSPGPLAQRSVKESWAQWSLRRGVESLPESLTEFLQRSGSVQLHREAAVKHIEASASGWKVCEKTVLRFSWPSSVVMNEN